MKLRILGIAISAALLSGCVTDTGFITEPVPQSQPLPRVATQAEIDAANGVVIRRAEETRRLKMKPYYGNEFVAEEVMWSTGMGRDSIVGTVEFYPTLGSNKATCAGLSVLAIPESRYAKNRMVEIYGNSYAGESINTPGPVDNEYVKYIKVTECNMYGEFVFNNVVAGPYYIVVGVTYIDTYGRDHKTGFMKRVHVSGDGVTSVVLGP